MGDYLGAGSFPRTLVGNSRYNTGVKTIAIPILLEFLHTHYPVEADAVLQPITKGEENQNFLVQMGAAQYVLRIYSTHHSTTGLRRLPEIEYELDFMAAAQAHDVPTPPVIRSLTGDPVTTVTLDHQAHFATLIGYAQGEEAAGYSAQIAHATSAALQLLRGTSLAFRKPSPRPWPGDIVRLSLDYYAMHRSRITHRTDILDRLYNTATSGYSQILSANLPTGVIHGDVKLGNLLFQDNRLSAVIDFDDYRETFLLEEFSRTVMHDLDSPTRNVIRAGFYPLFGDALAADPTVTSTEITHLTTFLHARLVYDLAAYALAGLNSLVDEVLADSNVQGVLLASL